jgi:type II secretory pathway component PulM
MKERWGDLSMREKQAMRLGTAITIMVLMYGLIWTPLHNYILTLRHQTAQQRALLTWLQTADQQIRTAEGMRQKSTPTHSAAARLSIIQNSLKQSQLEKNVSQLTQTENDVVQLNFQQVAFDPLIAWLTQLWQQQGLLASQVIIKPSRTVGMVTAELTLET